MNAPGSPSYVSRGGEKLAFALDHFALDVDGMVCADLGSHVGGFVDCLLQRGARRVYAVDTAYGTFAWRLRRDPRVVVVERTNAMHVTLEEPVDLVTIDVGWTPQARILPNTIGLLKPGGRVVSLVKPHYEAAKGLLCDGVLPEENLADVVRGVTECMTAAGWVVGGETRSPIRGHGGNAEFLVLLTRVGGKTVEQASDAG